MDVIRETKIQKDINRDYIRGLVDGEGSFTFSSEGKGRKIPSFQLRMHIRDEFLLQKVRDFLGLKNKIYTYHYLGKDGIKRGPVAILIIREFGSLKNVIIPLFYKSLIGYKSIQFNEWLEKIGSDPDVPERYKLLYRLHKNGFYSREHKLTD